MGLCNDRDDGGEVDVIDLLKFGVGIAGETCLRFSAAVCGKVFKCDVVDFHEGGLCACFDAEVADCDAVAHGQGRHTGAGKLHGVIICTVGADLSYDGQDQVASGGAVCQCASQVKAKGLGNQDPGGSGHHAVEVISTSDAGAEGAQGAVRAGVAVRTEDQLSGDNMILDHDLMTYACALIEGDAVCLGKIAHFFLRSGGFGAVAGDVVVHDPDQLFHVRDARIFQIVVHINGQMGRAVVAHEIVEFDSVNLIGMGLGEAGSSGHDLFRNGHSHNDFSCINNLYLSRDAMRPPWSRMPCRWAGSLVQEKV